MPDAAGDRQQVVNPTIAMDRTVVYERFPELPQEDLDWSSRDADPWMYVPGAWLVGLASVFGAGPAAAHNTLTGSDPDDGAQVSASPQQVTLTFDQPVTKGFNTIDVTGPWGHRWEVGEVTVSGNEVSAPLSELGPSRELPGCGCPAQGRPRRRVERYVRRSNPTAGTPAPPERQPDGV